MLLELFIWCPWTKTGCLFERGLICIIAYAIQLLKLQVYIMAGCQIRFLCVLNVLYAEPESLMYSVLREHKQIDTTQADKEISSSI